MTAVRQPDRVMGADVPHWNARVHTLEGDYIEAVPGADGGISVRGWTPEQAALEGLAHVQHRGFDIASAVVTVRRTRGFRAEGPRAPVRIRVTAERID